MESLETSRVEEWAESQQGSGTAGRSLSQHALGRPWTNTSMETAMSDDFSVDSNGGFGFGLMFSTFRSPWGTRACPSLEDDQDLVDKPLHQVNGHCVLLSHTGFRKPASLGHKHLRVPILQLYPAQYAPQVGGHSLPVLDKAPGLTEVVGPEGQSKKVVGHNEKDSGTPCFSRSVHTCPIALHSHQDPSVWKADVPEPQRNPEGKVSRRKDWSLMTGSGLGCCQIFLPSPREPAAFFQPDADNRRQSKRQTNSEAYEDRPLVGSHVDGTPAERLIPTAMCTPHPEELCCPKRPAKDATT
ncbi:hypothetical protein EYF80_019253 [Liparis tanakae]|uniref:Uncharacterized protein n=1 Tax=Liparis tanakae TaxID=230148 RepID=A0A4Z2HXX8_9TELE|nr:hypothetical protein EYF80_019253 [Liparis tanakae]